MVKYYRTDDKKIREVEGITSGTWIQMIHPSVAEGQKIADELDVDIEDVLAALDEEESSRIELQDGYTLILVDIPTTETRHDKEAYTTIPLGIILTSDEIVTVCTEDTPVLQAFLNNRVKEFSTKKKLRFVYQILYRISVLYQSDLRIIDKMRTEIEERVGDDTEEVDLIALHELESTLVYFATSLRANGVVLDRLTRYKRLEQYPEELAEQEEFIREHWLHGRTADCAGLIKGYGWLNAETRELEYGTNGMPDLGSDDFYANATEKGSIDTIPELPGLAVWREGHIGIYVCNEEVIHASRTTVGVIRSRLADGDWTHWLEIPYISYFTELPATANEAELWAALYEAIQNPYGVAGLMGNLYAESGLRPDNLQDTYEAALGYTDAAYTQAVDAGSYPDFASDHAGYGLAQWTTPERKAALLTLAKTRGTSVADVKLQAEFLCQELQERFPAVLTALQNASSVSEASNAVLFHFEAPADQSEAVQAQRAAFGNAYYSRYAENGGAAP